MAWTISTSSAAALDAVDPGRAGLYHTGVMAWEEKNCLRLGGGDASEPTAPDQWVPYLEVRQDFAACSRLMRV
jgi:hypothetical protein